MSKYRVDTDNGSYMVETEDAPASVPGMEKLGGTPPGPAKPPNALRPSIPMSNSQGVITDKGADVPMGATAKAITAPLAAGKSLMESSGQHVTRGFTRMNKGAKDRAWYNPIPSSEELGGMSDVVRGVGEAALPIVAATNPVGTAVGMATGIPTGMAVEGGAKALGVPEGTSEFLGTASGGLAGGAAEAYGPRAVSRLKVPTSLNPKEAATVGFADQQDIPINAGTRTGNNVVKNAQGLVQNQPGGARYAQGATRDANAALSATGDRLASGVSPTAVTAEQAGAGVTKALQARIVALDAQADSSYGSLRALEKDPANIQSVQVGTQQQPMMSIQGRPIPGQTQTVPVMKDIALPVDMRGVKTSLRPIYDQIMQTMPLAQRDASPGLVAMKNILDGDDYVSASIADRNLSTIKGIARTADSPQLRNLSQGVAAKAIGELDPQIQQAVANANDPRALQYLKQGRKAVADKYNTADLAKGLSDEPVQVYRRLTSNGDAYIETLRDVQKKTPGALIPIGRAYLQGMLDTASDQGGFSHADKLFADWNRLGDQTKGLIFQNPQTIQNLDNFLFLAKRMAELPNPSKTAYVAALLPTLGLVVAQPHIGVPLVVSNSMLSRLLFNPKAAKLLTTGLSLPQGSPSAQSVGAAIGALAATKDQQPPKYSRGGIIRKPTLLVDAKTRKPTGLMAEAGAEAIVPLPPKLGIPGEKSERHLINAMRFKLGEQIKSGTRPPKLDLPRMR